jgi:hypothetical protein
MKDFFIFFGIFVLWFGLVRWVLPWFGISTCMSGNCRPTCCSSWDGDSSPKCDAPSPQGEDAAKTAGNKK